MNHPLIKDLLLSDAAALIRYAHGEGEGPFTDVQTSQFAMAIATKSHKRGHVLNPTTSLCNIISISTGVNQKKRRELQTTVRGLTEYQNERIMELLDETPFGNDIADDITFIDIQRIVDAVLSGV